MCAWLVSIHVPSVASHSNTGNCTTTATIKFLMLRLLGNTSPQMKLISLDVFFHLWASVSEQPKHESSTQEFTTIFNAIYKTIFLINTILSLRSLFANPVTYTVRTYKNYSAAKGQLNCMYLRTCFCFRW